MDANIQNKKQKLENKLVSARRESLQRLADIEHRLEFVDEVDGVEYINDAKSTDINSTWYSIDCLERPIIWLASSSKHEEDYALLKEIDTSKIKALIIMGSAKDELKSRFKGRLELIGEVNTVYEGVEQAMLLAEPNDTVLFSPSCSDYENFKHYKEAGQQFRKAVRETRLP